MNFTERQPRHSITHHAKLSVSSCLHVLSICIIKYVITSFFAYLLTHPPTPIFYCRFLYVFQNWKILVVGVFQAQIILCHIIFSPQTLNYCHDYQHPQVSSQALFLKSINCFIHS